jgi:hypothetical protein
MNFIYRLIKIIKEIILNILRKRKYRILKLTSPPMQGDDVKKLQERLLELDYSMVGTVDGIFSKLTETAVKEFQKRNNLIVNGIVDTQTWDVLFSSKVKPYRIKIITSPELWEFHGYKDSVRWKLTSEGVYIENSGIERTPGAPLTTRKVWQNFAEFINKWAIEYGIPAELIVATICTESNGNASAIRKEPGYISDDKTPNKISVGLMQTLISTARKALNREDIDKNWLLNPTNSIQAGCAYIKMQYKLTQFDPPKVACAYNAGSIYYNNSPNNRWKMRQFPLGTSQHTDRFIKWFNDFVYLINQREVSPKVSYFDI